MNQLQDIHDIRGPIDLSTDTALWIALVGGALFLILLSWYWLKRKNNTFSQKKETPALAPYEVALKALEEAKVWMQHHSNQQLAIAVSDAIRIYLENEYKLPAIEATTRDFLQRVSRQLIFKGKELQCLSAFLQKYNLIKFANQSLSEAERIQLHEQATEFLNLAQKQKYVFAQTILLAKSE